MNYLILLFTLSAISLFSQHLPLQIGNQWHYNQGLGPTTPNAAFAVDTVRIDTTMYYKIECRDAYTGEIIKTTYDRIEGDSLYFRYYYGTERQLFNFNWQNGQVIVTPWSEDSTCFLIQIMTRYPVTVFGVQTDYYLPNQGIYCPLISEDTAWVLSSYTYLKFFGSFDTQDGLLIGAVINGTTYGILHPLPVELISFNVFLNGNCISLIWETSTEMNNKGFEVQKSVLKNSCGEIRNHNSGWNVIGFVDGNGTSTVPHKYSYSESNVPLGKYVYRLKQIDFDGSFKYSEEVEVDVNAPGEYTLEQNYPNPFNPVTTIKYSIPAVGTSFMKFTTVLKIYDILGNEIATLVNEEKPAGNYLVNFDGSKLPSGVYIYRLTAGNYSAAKKLVLLR